MADFCENCSRHNDENFLRGKKIILSKELSLCEGCGQMKQVVIDIKEPNKGLTLMQRLDRAREAIQKAYDEENSREMGRLAKLIQDLYFECYNLDDDDCKERHYAEYLKLMIMLHFEFLFDGGGDTEGTYEACAYEAYMAGFGKHRLTGELRP